MASTLRLYPIQWGLPRKKGCTASVAHVSSHCNVDCGVVDRDDIKVLVDETEKIRQTKESHMKFSIRTLFAATLLFASTLAAYKVVPTLTLSIVLLVPLPAIGVALLSRRIRDRWRLIACTALPAVFTFYLGLIGPLTALVVMPEDWGLVQARPAIVATVNNAYPITLLDACGDSVAEVLTEYQVGWASLVVPKDDLHER